MTPAINAAKKAGIAFKIHSYTHDSSCQSYGLEAAEKLSICADRVFKTLLVQDQNKKPYVAIVPANSTLNMKQCATALSLKKVEMATPELAQRATGYVLGGISPLGQKQRLATIVDSSALIHETIFVSAGKRGMEIELAPADLLKLVGGKTGEIQTKKSTN